LSDLRGGRGTAVAVVAVGRKLKEEAEDAGVEGTPRVLPVDGGRGPNELAEGLGADHRGCWDGWYIWP